MPGRAASTRVEMEPQDLEDRQWELHAKFFDGLANPTRLKIVELLLERGELNVGEIIAAVRSRPGARGSSSTSALQMSGSET